MDLILNQVMISFNFTVLADAKHVLGSGMESWQTGHFFGEIITFDYVRTQFEYERTEGYLGICSWFCGFNRKPKCVQNADDVKNTILPFLQ